ALVCWMTWLPHGHRARLVGAGILIGALMLFRQFSGVVVAMAVIVIAVEEHSTNACGRSTFAARALMVVMLLVLIAYVRIARVELGGLIFFAAWPAAILTLMAARARTSNVATALILGQLGIGITLAAMPLFTYHLAQHSVRAWFQETITINSAVTQLRFRGGGWYGALPIVGRHQEIASSALRKSRNGLYGAAFPLVPAPKGLLSARRFHRLEGTSGLILPVVASFYALVSLHLEGPVYV